MRRESFTPTSSQVYMYLQSILMAHGADSWHSEFHFRRIWHASSHCWYAGNVLLSHHTPPNIRMADFGMSLLKSTDNLSSVEASTLLMTTHGRGTPVYSAPEVLINPFDETFDGRVAQCSRKTDMYRYTSFCCVSNILIIDWK